MSLHTMLFGNQKQASIQMAAVEEFVKNYVEDKRQAAPHWDDDVDADMYIGATLNDLLEKLQFPSTFEDDENYCSPSDWAFAHIFLGEEAVHDVCEESDCRFEADRHIQDNGKYVYYAWMTEDETGEELEQDIPNFVDASDAEEIIRKVIDRCPPSRREELPADDKLAAVLLSQTYWQGLLS